MPERCSSKKAPRLHDFPICTAASCNSCDELDADVPNAHASPDGVVRDVSSRHVYVCDTRAELVVMDMMRGSIGPSRSTQHSHSVSSYFEVDRYQRAGSAPCHVQPGSCTACCCTQPCGCPHCCRGGGGCQAAGCGASCHAACCGCHCCCGDSRCCGGGAAGCRGGCGGARQRPPRAAGGAVQGGRGGRTPGAPARIGAAAAVESAAAFCAAALAAAAVFAWASASLLAAAAATPALCPSSSQAPLVNSDGSSTNRLGNSTTDLPAS